MRYYGKHRDVPDLVMACKTKLEALTAMPERCTANDLREACGMLKIASDAVHDLISTDLPGCLCRRIRDDDYDYLEYRKECSHHGQLFRMAEGYNENLRKSDKILRDDARMKLIGHILGGMVASGQVPDRANVEMARWAIRLADTAISEMLRPDDPAKPPITVTPPSNT